LEGEIVGLARYRASGFIVSLLLNFEEEPFIFVEIGYSSERYKFDFTHVPSLQDIVTKISAEKATEFILWMNQRNKVKGWLGGGFGEENKRHI